MAGGNLSPRQKMINLMYLIFIAMLALNMSKEVLTGFGLINNKLQESNMTSTAVNKNLLKNIKSQKEEKGGDFVEAYEKASKLASLTNEFNAYIESIKTNLTKGVEVNEKTGMLDFERMDKGDYLDENWFGPTGLKPDGQKFKTTIEKYKTDILAILSTDKDRFANVIKDVEKRFDLSEVTNKDGIKVEYVDYHFKGYPSVTSLTKLTAYQTDSKKVETDVYNALLGEAARKALSVTKFQANVILDKYAFFAGEKVTGKVVLAKYDDNFNIKSYSGGTLENGQLKINLTAGGIGEQKISGKFVFEEDGKDIPLDFGGQYVVIPRPNQATISADKMNVVYRGLENPMTISFAGVPDSKVTATAPGLSKASGNGKYVMNPGAGAEVLINVSATLDDGSRVSDSQKFRIKSPPPPTGHVRGEYDVVRGPAQSLAVSTVTAKSLDFDFDMTWNVESFVVKVPGQATIRVNGSRMNPGAEAAIKKATRGDQISISEIIATGTGGIKLKAAPVIYEVQ